MKVRLFEIFFLTLLTPTLQQNKTSDTNNTEITPKQINFVQFLPAPIQGLINRLNDALNDLVPGLVSTLGEYADELEEFGEIYTDKFDAARVLISQAVVVTFFGFFVLICVVLLSAVSFASKEAKGVAFEDFEAVLRGETPVKDQDYDYEARCLKGSFEVLKTTNGCLMKALCALENDKKYQKISEERLMLEIFSDYLPKYESKIYGEYSHLDCEKEHTDCPMKTKTLLNMMDIILYLRKTLLKI